MHVAGNTFQSSPAPKGGRYLKLIVEQVNANFVSILARPEGRALQLPSKLSLIGILFQSSPAPKGGRYMPVWQLKKTAARVSILARPEGRALRVW